MDKRIEMLVAMHQNAGMSYNGGLLGCLGSPFGLGSTFESIGMPEGNALQALYETPPFLRGVLSDCDIDSLKMRNAQRQRKAREALGDRWIGAKKFGRLPVPFRSKT